MKNVYKIFLVMALVAISGCAYNETTNNYTANGDDNKFDTNQSSSTSKPVDVKTDVAGSGYGAVSK